VNTRSAAKSSGSKSKLRGGGLPRPALLAIVAVALLAIGFAVKLGLDASARSATRQQVLADTEQALATSPPDADVLSRCFTRLRELPDHGTAPDLLMAQARIELARDHADRAEALFGGIATAPGATPEQQGLGARILLRRQESGGLDAIAARTVLQQVKQLAQASYAASNEPDDLLRAWQAAQRLGNTADAKEIAGRLEQQHADAPAARFTQAVAKFDPKQGPGPFELLARDFPVPPPELSALRGAAALQMGDVLAGVQVAEAALLEAPGVADVRWVAAVAFHSGAVGSTEGSTERRGYAARRDAQLDWLAANDALQGSRAEQVAAMRLVR
jgi:hypothetical protein